MTSSASAFVPRIVEDVDGDRVRIEVHSNSADSGIDVYAELVDQQEDPGFQVYQSTWIQLDAFAARQLAAHLIQAAQAVEAAQ